jgi:hypothetical protein
MKYIYINKRKILPTIFNLPFLSKTLERVVAWQLQGHLLSNDVFSSMQSTYCRHFSTETALIRVQNDILLALDRGKEMLLTILDYSAALIRHHIIYHSILIWRLENRFGITGTALSWFILF